MILDNDSKMSVIKNRKHEGCLLSYYKINESTNRFFGVMMEIASEATIVSDRFDSEIHIEPKELKKLKITKELICKEFYFFLAGKKYMITTLPNNKMPKLIKYFPQINILWVYFQGITQICRILEFLLHESSSK